MTNAAGVVKETVDVQYFYRCSQAVPAFGSCRGSVGVAAVHHVTFSNVITQICSIVFVRWSDIHLIHMR